MKLLILLSIATTCSALGSQVRAQLANCGESRLYILRDASKMLHYHIMCEIPNPANLPVCDLAQIMQNWPTDPIKNYFSCSVRLSDVPEASQWYHNMVMTFDDTGVSMISQMKAGTSKANELVNKALPECPEEVNSIQPGGEFCVHL